MTHPTWQTRAAIWGLALALAFGAGGCASAYYGALEKIGIPKREVLADRIGDARGAQEEAKEQFASALEEFIAVTKVDPGQLEDAYAQASRELKRCEGRAEDVRDRIARVQNVADALFREWRHELDQYSSAELRRQSERQLDDTQRRYRELVETMQRAADRMEPVLVVFRDQVLFLKHNLNAQAVRSLAGTTRALQDDVAQLVADMERAIAEADAFVRTLQGSE